MAGALPDPIVREVYVDAAPETVFEFFTDAEKLTRWLAVEATLDPRPGGVCHQLLWSLGGHSLSSSYACHRCETPAPCECNVRSCGKDSGDALSELS